MIKYFCDKCGQEIQREGKYPAYYNGKNIAELCRGCCGLYDVEKQEYEAKVRKLSIDFVTKWGRKNG